MAVSPVARILQIFSGLGTVAITPFAIKFAHKNINQSFREGDRKINYNDVFLPEKEKEQAYSSNDEAMKKAVEILKESENGKNKEDKRGCFWMPKLPWAELFFCFNMDKLNSLFLFHFDKRAGDTLEKRLNRIGSIDVGREMTINFVSGKNNAMSHNLKTQRLKTHLAWMGKWKTTFKPSKHCQITKLNDKDYKLTCDASSEGTKRESWEHDISHSEVNIPKINL